jgi:hypothetical protein
MTKIQRMMAWKRAYAAFAAESMVFLIAYIAIAVGVPILIEPSVFAPQSIQLGLSDWVVRTWGIDLFAGGLLTIGGLAIESPRIERAGLALLFTGAFIFTFIIIGSVGWAGLLPGLTYAVFAWSAGTRFRKLGRVLCAMRLARVVEASKTVEES